MASSVYIILHGKSPCQESFLQPAYPCGLAAVPGSWKTPFRGQCRSAFSGPPVGSPWGEAQAPNAAPESAPYASVCPAKVGAGVIPPSTGQRAMWPGGGALRVWEPQRLSLLLPGEGQPIQPLQGQAAGISSQHNGLDDIGSKEREVEQAADV